MTILLIDDDEDDRWLFAEALQRTVPAVNCITAAGGTEAIELLTSEEVMPDMIYMDLNMPGMDGKRCLQILKQHPSLKHIPVTVYSTSNFHKDIQEAKALGASEFIIKPSDYSQLCNMFKAKFNP